MPFKIKDIVKSSGAVIPGAANFIGSFPSQINQGQITGQQPLVYGLWLTVYQYNGQAQNVHVKIKQPDGFVILEKTFTLGVKNNITQILPKVTTSSGALVPVLSGTYIFTFYNTSALQTPPVASNNDYDALVEVAYLRQPSTLQTVLNFGANPATGNPTTSTFLQSLS
jgi:hypothetical protein